MQAQELSVRRITNPPLIYRRTCASLTCRTAGKYPGKINVCCRCVCGILFFRYLILMKQLSVLLTFVLCVNVSYAQHENILVHEIRSVIYTSSNVEFPSYIDSALFAWFLNYNLQPDNLPDTIKHYSGIEVEIWYVVSKEGKITSAKSPENKNDALTNYILQIFLHCPYQWSPAYQNGRAVNSYHKIKLVY